MPWSEATKKMAEPRVLVEYKNIGILPSQASGIPDSNTTEERMNEHYVPQLAAILRAAGDHQFHTLPFIGYAWDSTRYEFAFLFEYPSLAADRKPQSLWDCLLSAEPMFKPTLKQRFRLAQSIARSIGALHANGWLHKSIRAHAIKFFFQIDGKTRDLDNLYLTNFELSRPFSAISQVDLHAPDIEHDIYRHPDRYGLPSVRFSKTHDVYSLGVVLLEIGLWQTARRIHDDIVKYEFKDNPLPGGVPAKVIKAAYIQEAKTRLGHRMGSTYQEAVLSCLTGELDMYLGSRHFAHEFERRIVQKLGIEALLS